MAHPEAVAQAREILLANADRHAALQAANNLADAVNEALNEAGLSAATSLLARVLIARAVLDVAATWWTDLMPTLPLPVTSAALRGIIDNPPLWLESVNFVDPEIHARNKRERRS